MSEVTPAPADAVAPSATTTPDAPKEAAAPPKPPRPEEELDAVLKKLGGLEVKANGKAHKVESVDKLLRYVQRGLPVESELERLAQQRAQLEPVAAILQQLQEGDEDAAEAALEKLLDSGKLDKVAEKRLRRLYEAEQKMAGMSPRERELAEALERERGEKTRLADERQKAEAQRRQQEEQLQVNAIKQHIGSTITKSLETMGLPPKLEPLAVEFMKPIIRASLNAGMPLDPAVLAEKVAPIFDELLSYRVKSLEGDALLKFLGEDTGGKVRKALLARLQGGGKAAAPEAAPAQDKASPQVAGPKGWDPRKLW